mgnify:CR=1 FL=1
MVRLSLLTVLTLFAFAGNSVLNRMALAGELIGPDTFAAARLVSGAIALAVIASIAHRGFGWLRQGSIVGAVSLAVYAVGFSFAYVDVDAGLGALLLFGVVQVSMFAAALMARQETISVSRWIGTGVALLGLVVLLLPGASAPSPPVRGVDDSRSRRLGLLHAGRQRRA